MSRKFTDNQGDDWVVALDVAGAKRVRSLLDVDLLSFGADEMLERLATDYVLLVDVIYVLCRETADQRQLSDVEFGRRLVGDPLDGARIALLRALCDFFPSRRQRVLAAMVDRIFAVDEAMLARSEMIASDGTLDRVVAQEVAKANRLLDQRLTSGGAPSTSSPADLDAIPGPAPLPSSSGAMRPAAKTRGSTRPASV